MQILTRKLRCAATLSVAALALLVATPATYAGGGADDPAGHDAADDHGKDAAGHKSKSSHSKHHHGHHHGKSHK